MVTSIHAALFTMTQARNETCDFCGLRSAALVHVRYPEDAEREAAMFSRRRECRELNLCADCIETAHELVSNINTSGLT